MLTRPSRRFISPLITFKQLIFLCVLFPQLTGAQTDFREVPQLIGDLRHVDSFIRKKAAFKLGELAEKAKPNTAERGALLGAVPELIWVLGHDTDKDVRREVGTTLGKIGEEAKAVALPQLLATLRNDQEGFVRAEAATALANMRAREAVPGLIEALKDENELVSSLAARALAEFVTTENATIAPLIDALGNKEKIVRNAAAESLGKLGVNIVPQLIESLKDQSLEEGARYCLQVIGPGAATQLLAALGNPDANVRSGAADVLGRIRAKQAVQLLIAALKDEKREVRSNAAFALGNLEDKEAVPHLVVVLNDPEVTVQRGAAKSLVTLSFVASRERATELRDQLKTAAATMRNSSDTEIQLQAEPVQLVYESLELPWWEQLKRWAVNHLILSVIIAVYPLLLSVWILLFWLRPLWLLHINEVLAKTTEIKLPAYLGGFPVAVRYLFLVGFFHYQSRVLDAWVANYIETARNNFSILPTVAERRIYVPLPVVIGDEAQIEVSTVALQSVFSRNFICVQIWGEGGSGKTALTCRLAQWAMNHQEKARLSARHLMLPVLIEQDLVVRDSAPEHPLFKAIKQQVKVMINEDTPPPAGLLHQLLKKRRVLVIVDGFSEMSEVSRTATVDGIIDLSVNAVIFTTRTDEHLTALPRTELKPLRVQGNRLATFMEVYLTLRKKRDLFADDEFFESCHRLSLIVGDRDITALLAKLYAEQMIAVKEHVPDADAPESIPELMLNYLNYLARDRASDDPDIRNVHRAAKSIGWECLKRTLKTTRARREDVLSALGGEERGRPLIEYLEAKLKVIQTVGAGRNQIRFALDPLAEYLAGMHLVEENGDDEQGWNSFLNQVDEQDGTPEEIRSFLLATRDCCLAKAEVSEDLRKVTDELARRAGITPERSERYRVKRRVRQLKQRPRYLTRP